MKFKRLSAWIVSTVMVLCMTTISANAVSVSDFHDVKQGNWFYGAVDYAVSHDLFMGTGSNTFSPDKPMTRGMFVTVLGRKSGIDTSRFTSVTFSDVKQNDYFAPYVTWASENGIVAGVGNNRFAPHENITREQMAAMLFRYAATTQNDVSYSPDNWFGFSDYGKVSAYAVTSMKWATSHHIIMGSGGKMSPGGTATRAEVAQVFMNCDSILQKSDVPVPTYDDALKGPHNGKTDTIYIRRVRQIVEPILETRTDTDYNGRTYHCTWNEQALSAGWYGAIEMNGGCVVNGIQYWHEEAMAQQVLYVTTESGIIYDSYCLAEIDGKIYIYYG
jgi:S-layer homology domain.